MTLQTSARLGLPLLQAGQAQKEVWHNEALMLLDFAVQPSVAAVGLDTPPASPALGACWIVGAAPGGAWTGQANAIAGWTDGGWRFVPPQPGMRVWSHADGADARFDGTRWTIGTLTGNRLVIDGQAMLEARQPAIAAPANGTVVDVEGRHAIAAILSALQSLGLIAAA
ncbi:DUF2793 domain-containing protein [Sphingomonas sp. PAMC 26605]|uniref:DUF2793 domain-containing protein n=1 Tax=Sphingomonas sp. PAMC 26605 TaxID=1112214 RepID=UPI00026CA227|nr:DUF2793 domain-containing protein [Sphingomonas sp. PAMC 26605]